eukprot:scaffold186346_cov26-Tisochrysis_lutea.AAC.2
MRHGRMAGGMGASGEGGASCPQCMQRILVTRAALSLLLRSPRASKGEGRWRRRGGVHPVSQEKIGPQDGL